jgi:RimJ/RimL family protein N-acetyltransferase
MNSDFITSVPYPHTERLVLREYRREDFDVFAAHLADPVSSAHLVPADRHAAWRIFCSQAGLWLIHGAGWWAVEEKETGRLVGNVGAFFREESTVMELGWNTYRAFWGHGPLNVLVRGNKPDAGHLTWSSSLGQLQSIRFAPAP